MIRLLAFRNLILRPWRSALLLGGFGLGVGVMIVLLSIGDAMVAQSRNERLVSGGDVTILPEGVDLELLKTGGVGGMWFSIPNARFIQLQVLGSSRVAPLVRTAAPQIEGKLVYLRTSTGEEIPLRATGEMPSQSAATGALPPVATGEWTDDAQDVRWRAPTERELRDDLDRFHVTPPEATNRESWSEWHYFNVLSADGRKWAFVTFALAGDVPRGAWYGQLLVTLHEQGKASIRFSLRVPPSAVRFSEQGADLALGASTVHLTASGSYQVHADVPRESGGDPVRLDLEVTPAHGAYFPGASLGSGEFVSGYVVPALRAAAAGTICSRGWCERFDAAQSYHDHNWGTWRGVTWDWGAARAGSYTILYGRVLGPDSDGDAPLFLYLVDSLGFRAAFRPRTISYTPGGVAHGSGRDVPVPSRAVMTDARGGDTLSVELVIDDATATDMRLGSVQRGDARASRDVSHPWFVQMKGTARLSGRVGGAVVSGTGVGFFESWR